MIVKLTKMGGVVRFIEATGAMQQPLENGRVDLEIETQAGPVFRFIIGEDMDNAAYPDVWHRAYIMERGKTVDTIRGESSPMSVRATVNGEPVRVTLTSVEEVAKELKSKLR